MIQAQDDWEFNYELEVDRYLSFLSDHFNRISEVYEEKMKNEKQKIDNEFSFLVKEFNELMKLKNELNNKLEDDEKNLKIIEIECQNEQTELKKQQEFLEKRKETLEKIIDLNLNQEQEMDFVKLLSGISQEYGQLMNDQNIMTIQEESNQCEERLKIKQKQLIELQLKESLSRKNTINSIQNLCRIQKEVKLIQEKYNSIKEIAKKYSKTDDISDDSLIEGFIKFINDQRQQNDQYIIEEKEFEEKKILLLQIQEKYQAQLQQSLMDQFKINSLLIFKNCLLDYYRNLKDALVYWKNIQSINIQKSEVLYSSIIQKEENNNRQIQSLKKNQQQNHIQQQIQIENWLKKIAVALFILYLGQVLIKLMNRLL